MSSSDPRALVRPCPSGGRSGSSEEKRNASADNRRVGSDKSHSPRPQMTVRFVSWLADGRTATSTDESRSGADRAGCSRRGMSRYAGPTTRDPFDQILLTSGGQRVSQSY